MIILTEFRAWLATVFAAATIEPFSEDNISFTRVCFATDSGEVITSLLLSALEVLMGFPDPASSPSFAKSVSLPNVRLPSLDWFDVIPL